MSGSGPFRSIVESFSVPLVISDAVSGEVRYANPAAAEAFGLTPGALLGRKVRDLYLDPGKLDRILERLTHGQGVVQRDVLVRGAEGAARSMAVSVESLFFDDEPALVSTFRDLTELRRTEGALKLRVQFEELLLGISTHFLGLGVDAIEGGLEQALEEIAQVTLARSGFVALLGAGGGTVERLVTHAGVDGGTPAWQGLLEEHLEWLLADLRGGEMTVLHSDRQDLPQFDRTAPVFSLALVPIVYDRGLRGLLGLESGRRGKGWSQATRSLATVSRVFANVLQRRDAEEDLASERLKANKLEAVGILAGGIAHDFRNILGVIQGNASLAQYVIDSPDQVLELLQEVEKASLRARDLTDQLLTFSKGGRPVKTRVAAGEVIGESVRFAMRGAKASCDLAIASDLWPAEADAGQLHQVLNNLLINANQAMPEGGHIRIRADNAVPGELADLPRERRYLRVQVADEGIGIPEDNLAKIFDPYFTTKDGGTGLGLATAWSIVKKHDGLLRVESVVGRGTAFFLYLPASDKPPAEPEPAEKPPARGQGRVLAVDDEAAILRVTVKMLEKLGYRTESCHDGAEAVELYRAALAAGDRFDIVLMDLTIPGGVGGREAMSRLQAIDAEARVIASSGYSNDPVMSDHAAYGFLDVLPKPFSIAGLSEVIRRAFES